MDGNTPDSYRVTLRGEWSAEQAAEHLEFLLSQRSQLTAEPPLKAEIDLSGITELDGCGCQLLAIFLEQLRRSGIPVLTSGIGEAIMDKIVLLGFAAAFAARAAGEEGDA